MKQYTDITVEVTPDFVSQAIGAFRLFWVLKIVIILESKLAQEK